MVDKHGLQIKIGAVVQTIDYIGCSIVVEIDEGGDRIKTSFNGDERWSSSGAKMRSLVAIVE